MRRLPRCAVLVLLVSVLALSGCWYQAGGGAGGARFNPFETQLTRDDVDTLAVQWRTPIDGFTTEPLISGSRIYVAARDYHDGGSLLERLAVQAYHRDTGALVWERSLLPPDGTPVSGSDVVTPALVNGELWVPYSHEGLGCAGEIARLDPTDGTLLGAEPTGRAPSALVVAAGRAAHTEGVCDGQGTQLVVRDTATGDVRWTHRFGAGSSVAVPTIADGRLFVHSGGSYHAFALDGCGAPTCAPLWTAPDDRTPFAYLRPVAGPDGTLVTVGPAEGPATPPTILVRDAATGAVRWAGEATYAGSLPGIVTGVAIAYDTIYVAGTRVDPDTSARVAVLDAYPASGCAQSPCAPAWSAELGETKPSREPTVAGGVVYVPLDSAWDVAPSMAAVDAQGCGEPTCEALASVNLVDRAGPYLTGPGPYATSVGSGRVTAAWAPGLYGTAKTELVSIGDEAS